MMRYGRGRRLLATIGMVAFGLPIALAAPAAAVAAAASCTRTGNIQVTNASTNAVIGFVSRNWNSFGEFVTTTTPADYLSVSVTSGASTDITALNGLNAAVPFVGGIVGFANTSDNLGTGSFNYAYLGGTAQTPPGSTPATGANQFTINTGIPEHIESAIWTLQGTTVLAPQWINTDSSKPATHVMDITNILVLTGDPTVFQNTFGPATEVTLTFVSATLCATTISTQASGSVAVGSPVNDVAIVAGVGNPTGTVTFTLYGPGDATCTGPVVFTSTNALSGGSATSGNFTPAGAGTYRWKAAYSGDGNNATANAACNDPNESVVVGKATPTVVTQASAGNAVGAPVSDTATLSGGAGPTGTVTFTLFSDAACATQVFTATTPLSGSTATSGTFTPAAAGTYYWTAQYNGDAKNNLVLAGCGAPNESVVIRPFGPPPPTRTLTGDVIGPVTVGAGESVLISGARVVGPVTVQPGGSLSVVNSQISRGITANAPSFFSLCGAQVAAPSSPGTALTVTNAAVPIRIGDPAAGCAGNRFSGSVVVTSNLTVTFGADIVSQNATLDTNGPGNTVIKADNVFGTLACNGNNPVPTNAGMANTAGSKTGQCSAL